MGKYTIDNKVTWLTTEDDINLKLSSVIGEKFIDYRKRWDLASSFQLETDFPLYLQLELHQDCNLRCPMCAIAIPEAREKYITNDHMSWELYQKIILEAEKYNCPSLSPQGINEPLLDKDLEKYIRFAADHGFVDIMINTNATLLTEERSRSLLKSGLTRLRFSLDAASKETFEKTRVGASHDQVMKNISKFLEIKKEMGLELPVVGVNFLKMKHNEHEEEMFIKKWGPLVDFIVIQEFTPQDFGDVDYSEFYTTDLKFQKQMKSGFRCPQPWQRIYIHNDGQACPCCVDFNRDLAMGNVNNRSIYEIWNSDEMLKLRGIHKDGKYWLDESCKKCVNGISGSDLIERPQDLRKIKAPN